MASVTSYAKGLFGKSICTNPDVNKRTHCIVVYPEAQIKGVCGCNIPKISNIFPNVTLKVIVELQVILI